MHAIFKHFENHTCPWWFIGLFDNPLRRLVQRPEIILEGLVQQGQTVLDVGPGMGYFSIPLARMVGERGTVIAADLQPQMLAGLRRRAERAGVLARIQTHIAQPERIGVTGPVDFALAFWMLHEVRDAGAFLGEIYALLKPGGRLLVAEPVIHVSQGTFTAEIQTAAGCGFHTAQGPVVRFSRSALFVKSA